MAIEHYHAVAVFEKFHAVNGVHNSSICDTFQVDAKGKVHSHHPARIVVVAVVE